MDLFKVVCVWLSGQGYGDPPSRGGADRMHAGNSVRPTQRPLQATAGSKAPCRPLFRDVVKTLMGLNCPNGGGAKPAANQEPTSSRFSNRFTRPHVHSLSIFTIKSQ